MSFWTCAFCILFMIYGIRLGGYLALRETSRYTYSKKMQGEIKESDSIPFWEKLLIWVFAALLYACQTSPVTFRLANEKGTDTLLIFGVILSACGVIIEIVSDTQKQAAKRKDPARFVSTGLFSIVRCPNYLGELILWTGVFLSGVSVLNSAWQWIAALAGYLGIIYVMFSGARRLELRQERTYGSDPEYREYVKKTPIMIPFIPLYSVKDQKWLVA